MILVLLVYPSLALVVLVALVMIFFIYKFVVRTSTDSLRHDAISRSPINSLFSTTL